jgi:hypothetical protein
MRVVKNRIHRNAKRRIAGIAVVPHPFLGGGSARGRAIRADRNALPADTLKMRDAISFFGESLVNLDYVHGYLWLGQLGQKAGSLSRESCYLNLGHSVWEKRLQAVENKGRE